MPSLVETGEVVVEKNMYMSKVYRLTDDEQLTIRKVRKNVQLKTTVALRS